MCLCGVCVCVVCVCVVCVCGVRGVVWCVCVVCVGVVFVCELAITFIQKHSLLINPSFYKDELKKTTKIIQKSDYIRSPDTDFDRYQMT